MGSPRYVALRSPFIPMRPDSMSTEISNSKGGRTARRAIKRAAKQSIANLGTQCFCVLYLRGGKERRSPWFSARSRAHLARELLAAKYGPAIVYID